MSALKSLLLAVEVAERKREQAQAAVLHANKALHFAESQLHQLTSYSSDTADRWLSAAQLASTPELMQNHYQFMGRLDHAIALQRQALEKMVGQVALAKQRLLESDMRLAALKLMADKRQHSLVIERNRRDQKEMDEFAALQYSRSEAGRQQEFL
jgi:flagellar FliJ protein